MKNSRTVNKSKKVDWVKLISFVFLIIVILLAIIFIIYKQFNNSNKDFVNKDVDKVVVNDILVTELVVDKTSLELEVGGSFNLKTEVKPLDATNKEISFLSNNPSIASVDRDGKVTGLKAGSCKVTVYSFGGDGISKEVNIVVKAKVVATNNTDSNNGVDKITYIQGILVVNKTYALPSTYNPGLSATTTSAFNTMKTAAAKDGINLFIVSGYRSYSYQAGLYNRYVERSGQAEADRYSARPGHSEHQTGLAIDLNSADSSFAGTKEAIWLANNSYKYGFIVRYPKGKESVTGYMYEPWHMRFLGVESATKVFNSGLCLEEFLNIDSKYR
ncbi:MAG: D-alanyl-D-alanine carboxypeptidase family protein [Firmicutes bacterium]|nr:D-alanyl-D-alanine carboxypeptidase family protein [Bacillota bacterium]